jgi:acid phosphatase
MLRFLLFLTASFALAAQERTYENLNAILWMQRSAEYQAAARQTYRAAEDALTRALEDVNWTAALEQFGDYRDKPPAVILDLDETVLDNSPFQARLTRDGKAYSDAGWQAWVAEEAAGSVPGAIEFLKFAHANGVVPVYITKRTCNPADPKDPTVAVLRKLDAPFLSANLLCRDRTSDKSPRRAIAQATYRILLLIGDDFNDFLTAAATVEQRQRQFDLHQRFFGERWFLLPNPSYGGWEGAVGRQLNQKLDKLRP